MPAASHRPPTNLLAGHPLVQGIDGGPVHLYATHPLPITFGSPAPLGRPAAGQSSLVASRAGNRP